MKRNTFLVLLILSSNAYSQEWLPVELPPDVRYIRMAAISESKELLLWGAKQSIVDSTRSVFIIPWTFYRGSVSSSITEWNSIDSGQFTLQVRPDGSIRTSWFDVVASPDIILRSFETTESPDITRYSFERYSQGAFTPVAMPGPVGSLQASPLLYLSTAGMFFHLRYRVDDDWDSTRVFLYRNSGSMWQSLNDSANVPRIPRPTSLSFRPGANSLFYLGTVLGLYRTGNGAQTWNPVISGTMMDQSPVRSVKLHPSGSGPIYVVARSVSGNSLDYLFRSRDNGFSWKSIYSDSLISHVALTGGSLNNVLIATQSGLKFSTDMGDMWRDALLNLPPPNVDGRGSIQWIHLRDTDAFIAYGQSLYRSETLPLSTDNFSVPLLPEVTMYPIPVMKEASLFSRLIWPESGALEVRIKDILGRTFSSHTLDVERGEITNLPLNVRELSTGTWFVLFQSKTHRVTKQFQLFR